MVAPVPPRVLNWLQTVLAGEYRSVTQTYNDIADTLARLTTLAPRTEVYTYENGVSALLLNLSGTLPVTFRGSIYHFPVSLWVPHAYPREAPMVYITPTEGMMIRPGQHVSGEGKVYHPYLAGWTEFWDKSNISDLLSILCDIFAKEPPVVSTQQKEFTRSNPQVSNPPEVPPLPPELDRIKVQNLPRPAVSSLQSDPALPPLPPKGFDGDSQRTLSQAPPHLPAKGHRLPIITSTVGSVRGQYQHELWAPDWERYPTPGSRQTSRNPERSGTWSQWGPSRSLLEPTSSQVADRSQFAHSVPLAQQSPVQGHPMSGAGLITQGHSPARPNVNAAYSPDPTLKSAYRHANDPPQQQQQQQQQQQPLPTNQAALHQPIEDLLSSSLDIDTSHHIASETPTNAPPIPPNPEKDALLRAIGKALYERRTAFRQRTHSHTLPALRAQHAAMIATHASLQHELSELESLEATLSANEGILAQCMRQADEVVHDTRNRSIDHLLPANIDDLLVAPTVVGQQLYRVVAEERALKDVLFVLAKALDQGRIGLDVYFKQTRSLARERFLLKALIDKIAKTMGLDMDVVFGSSKR